MQGMFRGRRCFFLLLCGGLALLLGGPSISAQERSRAWVLDRYVEAMGGRANLARIRSVVVEGNVLLESGDSLALKVMKKRPNLVRTVLGYPDGSRLTTGYNGETAWQQETSLHGTRLEHLEIDEFHPIVREAQLESPLAAAGFNKDWIEYLGEVRIEGNLRCHHLRVSWPQGASVDYYIDVETFFERKTVKSEPLPDGSVATTEMFPSDFRFHQGVVFSHRVVVRADGGDRSELNVREIRINEGIVDSLFRIPEDASVSADQPFGAAGR